MPGTLKRVTEYGSEAFNRRGLAAQIVMESGTDARFRTVSLVRSDAGWEPAGSMARWTDGYYAVRKLIDGAEHGRRFVRTSVGLAAARAMFAKWTEGGAE